MSGSYILRKGVATVNDLVGGASLQMLGMGNVYFVIKSTEAFYASFLEDHLVEYSDGSVSVYNDIQSGLDAAVEFRNDYVVVMPSNADYDITAELTMSKKSVHLICPGGLGNVNGATNAARIEQLTGGQAVIAVSDSAIEIAGLYLKNEEDAPAITLAATSYSPNIHNNTLVMTVGSSQLALILGAGDGGAWGSIESNWIVSYGGDNQTIAKIIEIQPSATCARVKYNEITMGDGNTATVGIYNLAVKGRTDYNTFGTGGGGSSGAFSHCIQIHNSGSAIGNRGTVADSELVVGGTNAASFSDNMNAVTGGGVVDDEQ